MNQLFLKKKSNKYLFLFFLLPFYILANDSIPNASFKKHYRNSDAYLLYSYTDVTYAKSFGDSYKEYVTISNKLVVNNGAGVDKFAYLNLSEYVSNNIYEIDVETLKSDGTIIELDSSKVFQTKANQKRFDAIEYPIPGVEQGDTIKTSYTYTRYVSINEMTDFVNLYNNIPSLNTEYSIKIPPELSIRYKRYNEFPEPQVVSNDSLVYCVFKMENIKSLTENPNTCLPCELPYVYYSIEKKNKEIREWEDVYNQEFNAITQPMSLDSQNASYFNKWKRSVIGDAKDSSNFYKFKLLHADIIKNITMEPAKERELIKSNGFFLKEKRFNPISIRRLYRQILEDLKIEYWAVFARSKRAGSIDPYYIRKGEYDHIFFAYENELNTLSLLYPHEEYYKYQIDEIPTSIYNTEAVIAKPYLTKKIKKKDKFIGYDLELAEADSVTISMVKLPSPNATRNYVKQIYSSNIDFEEKEIPLKYKFSVSGGLYTELKSFFELLSQNKEVNEYYDAVSEFEGKEDMVVIDTIKNTYSSSKRPFVYSIEAEGSLEGVVSFLNDQMVSVSLDKLLQHNQIESEEDKADLNYYLDYSFSDHVIAIFNFPQEVEILDIDAYNTKVKNKFGTYSFDLKLVEGNRVTLQSIYKIDEDMIPKESYNELKEINESIEEIMKKRILIKLKE